MKTENMPSSLDLERLNTINDVGSYHEMADGTRVPLSLVNSTAPDFRIPASYDVSDLDFNPSREDGYDPQIAHFLSLCMKLVYEEDIVIEVGFDTGACQTFACCPFGFCCTDRSQT